MSKYLEFRLVEKKLKTTVWFVLSKTAGTVLGKISWFPQWRQYTFDSMPNTTFNYQCLDDISSFIKEEMEKRKR